MTDDDQNRFELFRSVLPPGISISPVPAGAPRPPVPLPTEPSLMTQQPQLQPGPDHFQSFTPMPGPFTMGMPCPPPLKMAPNAQTKKKVKSPTKQKNLPFTIPNLPGALTATPINQQGPAAPPQPEPKQQSVKFKGVKDFISHLLAFKNPEFQDHEFAEKALANLARKISQTHGLMSEWEKAIQQEDPTTGCVTIVRPKDGRMAVTKSSTVGGSKKVYPQIIVCQIFRWPLLIYHNDIKSAEECRHPTAVKPGSDGGAGDPICINPYHYVLSAEGETRMNKSSKTEKVSQKAEKTTSKGEKTSPKPMKSPKSSVKTPRKRTPKKPGVKLDLDSSGEAAENSSVGSEVMDFDDCGIDYVKLWEQKAVTPDTEKIELTPGNVLGEIKFVSLVEKESGEVEAVATDSEVLEKLHILTGLEKLLLDPDFIESIRPTSSNPTPFVPAKDPIEPVKSPPVADIVISEVHGNEVPEASPPPKDTDDTSIQELLDDIRGSFERQFDDEFNDLAATESTPPVAGSSQPALDTSWEANQDLFAPSSDEMPCIVNAWSVPEEGPGFLAAGSISQEEFDNMFASEQQGQFGDIGGSQYSEQFDQHHQDYENYSYQ